jgi:hypothetical protein
MFGNSLQHFCQIVLATLPQNLGSLHCNVAKKLFGTTTLKFEPSKLAAEFFSGGPKRARESRTPTYLHSASLDHVQLFVSPALQVNSEILVSSESVFRHRPEAHCTRKG